MENNIISEETRYIERRVDTAAEAIVQIAAIYLDHLGSVDARKFLIRQGVSELVINRILDKKAVMRPQPFFQQLRFRYGG